MGTERNNPAEVESAAERREALLAELDHAWTLRLPHDEEGDLTSLPPEWEVNSYGYRATYTDESKQVTKLELRMGRLYDQDGQEADLELIEGLIRVLRDAATN